MDDRKTQVIDLSRCSVGIGRDGEAMLIESRPGPPERIDGYTIGTPLLEREPPHAGEMHPDGDELLHLLSGRVDVLLEEADGDRVVALQPGDAIVVPRGIWHRVLLREPSRLLHVTPGPGGEHRPRHRS